MKLIQKQFAAYLHYSARGTAAWVSRRMRVSDATVSRWASGARCPNERHAKALRKIMERGPR